MNKLVPVEKLRELKVYSDQRCVDAMLSAGCSVVRWEELDALLCDSEIAAAPATEPSEVKRLAMEIADEAAWELIMSERGWETIDGAQWRDCSPVEGGLSLEKEIRYLEMRGLIIHHATRPELVRVKEEKS